jgi:hypothetical protein
MKQQLTDLANQNPSVFGLSQQSRAHQPLWLDEC